MPEIGGLCGKITSASMKTRIALFPGSFDPFTNGHLDVVRRGAELFDEVIVAIGNNSSKSRYLPVEQMVAMIEEVFRDEPRVSVRAYKGLTADFAREVGARYLLRGLRNTTDFEYENTIAQANRHVNPDACNDVRFRAQGRSYGAAGGSGLRRRPGKEAEGVA